jgi:hypothetical protein
LFEDGATKSPGEAAVGIPESRRYRVLAVNILVLEQSPQPLAPESSSLFYYKAGRCSKDLFPESVAKAGEIL